MIKALAGVDVAKLSSAATPILKNAGKTLLYDGDSACYEVTAGVARLETAQRRLEKDILTMMYLTGVESARVHLTPKGCYKYGRKFLLGQKPYQDNRSNQKKPALLEPLRLGGDKQFQHHTNIKVILNWEGEADDGLMQDAYILKDEGILVSYDKDLLLNPYPSYDPKTGKFVTLPAGNTFGWIDRFDWLTPTGKKMSKMVGKGTKFFWAQMLMGDTADNVQGILKLQGKLCGMVGALDYLRDIQDESQAANAVIDAYRAIDQNPIPEAEAMWLRRTVDDTGCKYISSLDLTPTNRSYLRDCYRRKWKMTDAEIQELENDE